MTDTDSYPAPTSGRMEGHPKRPWSGPDADGEIELELEEYDQHVYLTQADLVAMLAAIKGDNND